MSDVPLERRGSPSEWRVRFDLLLHCITSFALSPLLGFRGYHLPAKHVIHTVGPIYESKALSEPLLARAYRSVRSILTAFLSNAPLSHLFLHHHRSSLALANEHNLSKVAFPAISTGVFGYPKAEAAEVRRGRVRRGALRDVLTAVCAL